MVRNLSIAPKLLILILPIITAICLLVRPNSASSKSVANDRITQSASPSNPSTEVQTPFATVIVKLPPVSPSNSK